MASWMIFYFRFVTYDIDHFIEMIQTTSLKKRKHDARIGFFGAFILYILGCKLMSIEKL